MHYIAGKEEVSAILITKHNIRYLLRLMERLRNAIETETLDAFVCGFVEKYFRKKERIPEWVMEGLRLGQIDLEGLKANQV